MSPHQNSRGRTPTAPDALPIPVVDNHAHLDISRDDEPAMPVAEAIERAAAVGVDRIVQIGCDLEAARWTVDQLADHPALLGGIALHPNEVPKLRDAGKLEEAWRLIEEWSAHPRIRVIGETGLDYFRTGADGVAVQQDSFRWHIDLAKRTGKALQVHDREAHDDVLRILREEGAPAATVLHCFSGGIVMARECIEAGYFLSFAGTVTFKSSNALRDALSITPLDQVLVETDAPYLTPMPWRGSTNASYLVPHTVRVMATTLNIDVPTLCAALSENSERVYGPW